MKLFVTLIIAALARCCLPKQNDSEEFEVHQFACHVQLADVEERNDHNV